MHPATDSPVLNAGLELAIAFGPDWLKPIQARLAVKYPELIRAELNAYDAACREAMCFGHRQLAVVWKEAERNELLARTFLLVSQSFYDAWKDGNV